MITHIDHVVLTVRDIDAAVAFYTEAIGMQAISFAGSRKALKFGTQKINLQTLGQETRNHAAIGSGDLCLITDWPIQDVIEHLREKDIALCEGPVQKSGAQGPITSVYFNDPDGNLIEVSRYD
ncbi:VOC family protein [Oricola nitratireducens]|uniref:VOC family protein n=1 Tax=Oricola nitratireducens TaxID=2775868 RepID=UPI001866BF37|nr:VOC family protein [Oricola nitratireducens]